MVVRDPTKREDVTGTNGWRVIGHAGSNAQDDTDVKMKIEIEEVTSTDTVSAPVAGQKRPHAEEHMEDAKPDADAPDAKRARSDMHAANGHGQPTSAHSTSEIKMKTEATAKCLAPSPNGLAQAVLSEPLPGQDEPGDGYGDIFLSDNFRERWCHCEEVRISFAFISAKSSVFGGSMCVLTISFVIVPSITASSSLSPRRRGDIRTSGRS